MQAENTKHFAAATPVRFYFEGIKGLSCLNVNITPIVYVEVYHDV